MYKLIIDRDELLAFVLLSLLLAFLSCPFLAHADATVNGFFPKNFVTQGWFKEERFQSFTKPKFPKPQSIKNAPLQKDKCKQILNSSPDTFAIPVAWSDCTSNKDNR